ncbi:cation diffusion facilitator family transporter [Crocinitomix algicola]|uniref:cation diffusion facilitator family transporter n=1 Tax=Crocinitomix algicola TaxID=1740263 RepID=UPI000837733E|nr:cation diffusion facilitator family transporter [Crocinitomix algicola]
MDHHHASKNISIAFFLNLSFTIIELIGGILTNSVAIISDAIHDFGDTIALGTSWYLEKKSDRQANQKFTYGYRRLSIFSAFINCIILLIGSSIIIFEAIKRLINPETVDVQGMIYLAILGILVNSIGAWKVIGGKSLNEQTISWHLLEDVFGWVAVLIGSIVMYYYPLFWIDSALSIGIALFISYIMAKKFKRCFKILAQATPVNIDLKKIEESLLKLPVVHSLHYTHIWSLDESKYVFSSHIVVNQIDNSTLPAVQNELSNWNIWRETIQFEVLNTACTVE